MGDGSTRPPVRPIASACSYDSGTECSILFGTGKSKKVNQSFIWQRSLKKGQLTRVPFELALKLALDLTLALVQLPLAIPELVPDAVVFVAAFAAVPEAFPVPLAVPFAIVQIPVMVALPRLAEKLARLRQRMHAVRCVVRGMASLKSWNVRLASGRALP